MSTEVWVFVFMGLILKLPVIYVAAVVWYAIKAEPEPGIDPHEHPVSVWRPWHRPDGPRPRRGGPHGSRDTAGVSRARRDRVAP